MSTNQNVRRVQLHEPAARAAMDELYTIGSTLVLLTRAIEQKRPPGIGGKPLDDEEFRDLKDYIEELSGNCEASAGPIEDGASKAETRDALARIRSRLTVLIMAIDFNYAPDEHFVCANLRSRIEKLQQRFE